MTKTVGVYAVNMLIVNDVFMIMKLKDFLSTLKCYLLSIKLSDYIYIYIYIYIYVYIYMYIYIYIYIYIYTHT